jgi:hypothetical protein
MRIWVPGNLKNWANAGGYYGGPAEASYRKRWRTNVQLLAIAERNRRPWPAGIEREPKVVRMKAYVWSRFDSIDGLRNACKPIPDGLVKARIIHDDSDRSGHRFIYQQAIDRGPHANRGVLITVELVETR